MRNHIMLTSHANSHFQVITKSRNKAINVLKFTYDAAAILHITAKLRSRSGLPCDVIARLTFTSTCKHRRNSNYKFKRNTV